MATDARARTRTHTHTHTHTRTHAHTHARADTQTSMAALLQYEFTQKRECDVKVHLTDHKNGDETCSELSDLDENRSSQRDKHAHAHTFPDAFQLNGRRAVNASGGTEPRPSASPARQ